MYLNGKINYHSAINLLISVCLLSSMNGSIEKKEERTFEYFFSNVKKKVCHEVGLKGGQF